MNKAGREKIVDILIKRDGVTREEALDMFRSARSEIMDAIMGSNCLDPEDVLMDELGLEPDYLMYIL